MGKLDQAVVVVVTGGGSGIGRSMCMEAARRGAKVLVADIVSERAIAVADEIEKVGGTAHGTSCDVSSLDSVNELAQTALSRFGAVNLVCSNAGVCVGGTSEATSPDDVRWMFGVNVFGIYHGIRVFSPLLREAAQRGEFAHLLNTGSENSLGIPTLGPVAIYNATKHAVLALSDTARIDLAGSGVGVSILCPALVCTDLLDSHAYRPQQFGGPKQLAPEARERARRFMAKQGHDPDATAQIALDGVEAGRFLIVPHAEVRPFVETRMGMIAEALDVADALERRGAV